LLTALESEGLVARHLHGETYHLGPEIIVLGGRALRANDLRVVCRAELELLARTTGESATLETLAGDEIVVLDEVIGTRLIGATQSIGSRWPAHATSTGKALLACLPKAERELYLQRPLAQITAETIMAPDLLCSQFDRINEQGFATAVEELEVGFAAVGAVIYNHDGRPVAALSLNGPTARLTPDRLAELAPLVMAAAERVSGQLGYKK
jgi:DNA-binding IclR family transcriptional regulator